ncbi:hypothetical protein Prudu_018276 [Prunus dulcis]|uniref:Uncharacterized protein n=1 Tax=Prunus dulcis TaxID=3755 RepID=A0A4Y1RQE2_PRUDU|nr:hypothetical protein Prudu_018276 [Prunus dulcis]
MLKELGCLRDIKDNRDSQCMLGLGGIMSLALINSDKLVLQHGHTPQYYTVDKCKSSPITHVGVAHSKP